MSNVELLNVNDRRDLRRFIEFPYELYRRDPYWVPPLRIAQRELFDTTKHPFYKKAELQCFLAVRDGRVCGRIAAILDRTQFEPGGTGFFGFFESIDSRDVTDLLVNAARSWLAGRGAQIMRGPMNPSMNYECGVLVEGFDSSPYVMMTYNPPFYDTLLTGAGLSKAKDLLAYTCHPDRMNADKCSRVATRALQSNGLTIRPIDMSRFDQEVEAIWQVYNSAWSRNWGYAPMSAEEFKFSARDMKQILIPNFVLVGEVKGSLVGFALGLPDLNQALKRAGGDLFPFGLFKILYHKRAIRNLRVVALGVMEEYRTAGVAAGFYARLIEEALRLGWGDCEFSWVLEDNLLMNRSLEALGGRRYKTYRIYEGIIDHASWS